MRCWHHRQSKDSPREGAMRVLLISDPKCAVCVEHPSPIPAPLRAFAGGSWRRGHRRWLRRWTVRPGAFLCGHSPLEALHRHRLHPIAPSLDGVVRRRLGRFAVVGPSKSSYLQPFAATRTLNLLLGQATAEKRALHVCGNCIGQNLSCRHSLWFRLVVSCCPPH